ncbi:MAG TPA: ATP-grasp domain-containing protein, partial [Ktedonobacterales bacterium]|nr:ATP-grasp domain-containing protein [Ktedonobacterales bacterium]
MLLIYCRDPLVRGQPDAAFASEVGAAERLGLPYALINFEALIYDGDASRAVRAIPAASQTAIGMFRGWMLRPEQYAQLYAALLDRGVRLINDPAAYRHCHYLPESYERIASWTPRTVWLPLASADDMPSRDALRMLLAPFGDRPLIVKDYVKSRKHEWLEACFIPSATDLEGVERVVRRFLELQGDDLAGGLVFREYVA